MGLPHLRRREGQVRKGGVTDLTLLPRRIADEPPTAAGLVRCDVKSTKKAGPFLILPSPPLHADTILLKPDQGFSSLHLPGHWAVPRRPRGSMAVDQRDAGRSINDKRNSVPSGTIQAGRSSLSLRRPAVRFCLRRSGEYHHRRRLPAEETMHTTSCSPGRCTCQPCFFPEKLCLPSGTIFLSHLLRIKSYQPNRLDAQAP